MNFKEYQAIAAAAAKVGDIAPPASSVPTTKQVRRELGWNLINVERRA